MKVNKKTKGSKLVLEIPEEIRKLAQTFQQQRIAKEQAERLEKRKNHATRKLLRAARVKAGLKYATKVFYWAKALRESDLGRELMMKSHIPTSSRGILFFDDHVGALKWVALGICPEGLFLTYGGRFSVYQPIPSPKALAELIEPEVLKRASEWIDSGEVWKTIRYRFDYSKK